MGIMRAKMFLLGFSPFSLIKIKMKVFSHRTKSKSADHKQTKKVKIPANTFLHLIIPIRMTEIDQICVQIITKFIQFYL